MVCLSSQRTQTHSTLGCVVFFSKDSFISILRRTKKPTNSQVLHAPKSQGTDGRSHVIAVAEKETTRFGQEERKVSEHPGLQSNDLSGGQWRRRGDLTEDFMSISKKTSHNQCHPPAMWLYLQDPCCFHFDSPLLNCKQKDVSWFSREKRGGLCWIANTRAYMCP